MSIVQLAYSWISDLLESQIYLTKQAHDNE